MREDDTPCCEPKFWVYLIICLVLVSFAGITSGLTLGLLSYSQVDLEVLIKAGMPQDQKNAAKILPIVKNEYLLLCTLLIGKSLAMETLLIFLDAIIPFWAAILVSVMLVLAFAEIIPQAVCSRYGLRFGAKFSVLVRFLLSILFPVSYPISKLLDWLLGKGHFALLRRAELKKLVDLHGSLAGKGGELTHDETTIIIGALDMVQKTAKDAMTPLSETFSLDINSKLDIHTMGLIMSKGHSRVPIYSGSPTNIVGLILVKNLIFYRPEDETPIRTMTIRRIPRIYENWPQYDILNQFQKGHSHMAVVVKGKMDAEENAENAKGKTSLLEIMTSSNSEPNLTGRKEILDETDEYVDVHNKIKVNLLLPSRRSSPTSPGADSVSRFHWRRSSSTSLGADSVSRLHWRIPEPSPLSSYYHTPVLRSPVSPYIQTPLTRPVLYASPGKSIAGSAGPVHSSPSSHRV